MVFKTSTYFDRGKYSIHTLLNRDESLQLAILKFISSNKDFTATKYWIDILSECNIATTDIYKDFPFSVTNESYNRQIQKEELHKFPNLYNISLDLPIKGTQSSQFSILQLCPSTNVFILWFATIEPSTVFLELSRSKLEQDESSYSLLYDGELKSEWPNIFSFVEATKTNEEDRLKLSFELIHSKSVLPPFKRETSVKTIMNSEITNAELNQVSPIEDLSREEPPFPLKLISQTPEKFYECLMTEDDVNKVIDPQHVYSSSPIKRKKRLSRKKTRIIDASQTQVETQMQPFTQSKKRKSTVDNPTFDLMDIPSETDNEGIYEHPLAENTTFGTSVFQTSNPFEEKEDRNSFEKDILQGVSSISSGIIKKLRKMENLLKDNELLLRRDFEARIDEMKADHRQRLMNLTQHIDGFKGD